MEDQPFDGVSRGIIAALPPLVYGAGIALGALILGGSRYFDASPRVLAGLGMWLLTVLVLVAGGVIAIGRGMPPWGYTWAGSGLMGLFHIVVTLADDKEYLISPVADGVVAGAFVVAGLALVGVAAWRGVRQAGLFSLGFTGTMGLSFFFWILAAPASRFDLVVWSVPASLLVAALSYGFASGGRLVSAGSLVGVWAMNLGLLIMSQRVWADWRQTHGYPDNFWQLLVILSVLLLGGPIAGMLVQRLRGKLSPRTA